MKSAILALSILPALLGAIGCFDVHRADPGPWVIDDFEDGDLKPADANFGPWACQTYNPSDQACSVGLDPGNESSLYALFLQFTIADPPDGVEQSGLASLQTGLAETPENFSRFDEIVFSAKLTSGSPSLPDTTELLLQLGCSTVPADDGTTPGDLYVIQSVPYASYWQPHALPVASFGSPVFLTKHPLGGPTTCLEHVDSLQFTVNPLLPDGQSATGRLDVDDIYLQ